MEQAIQKRMLTLIKLNQNRLAEKSGIQSSLSEEDIKEYLQQVIREIEHTHKHKQG